MIEDDPETDTVWVFPAGADLSIFNDFEATQALILQFMGTAAHEAVAKNDRLGIPSWSRDGDDLVARLKGEVVERRHWKKAPEPT